jgi:succinyl-CoA synthetase beta subunit
MNIHEYQAKTVLRGFGVPTPRGIAAFTPGEAVTAARDLKSSPNAHRLRHWTNRWLW